jgi:hypothetical protein
MVLVMPGRRLYLMRGGQRCLRESWKATLGSQWTWSENWHSDSLNKIQLTLSQGKKKKREEVVDDEDVDDEDVDDADVDDVMRTSESQYQVTATLCTEKLFLLTQYTVCSSPRISGGQPCGGGRENTDVQHNTFGGPSLGSPSQPDLTVGCRFSDKTRYFHTVIM